MVGLLIRGDNALLDGCKTLRYPDSMQVLNTDIPGVRIVDPGRHMDDRGWLSEVWSQQTLADAGLDVTFTQDNLTFSPMPGVVRALHYQIPPEVQGKLITCLTGAIYDVALDIRVGSPTYGQHFALELRADHPRQLWVPPGLAHGYCSIKPDSMVLYKLTAPYDTHGAFGVLWNDPALEIDWPVSGDHAIVNGRDSAWPHLAELDSPFRWEE